MQSLLAEESMSSSELVSKFITKFYHDRTTTLAASLAFYTALSLAPLLILFVTLSSLLSVDVQQSFVDYIRDAINAKAALTIEMIFESAKARSDLSSLGSIFGLLTLVLSASLIFGELRSTLNRIFRVHEAPMAIQSVPRLAVDFLKSHLVNIALALAFIVLLIVSLAASIWVSTSVHPEDKILMVLFDFMISLVFHCVLFTLIYRFVPAKRLRWSVARRAGLLTGVLFVIGKQLIGSYLGHSALSSAYGAAGSIILVLAWVYYSALITFIGAQLSTLVPPSRRFAS
jgi:membrane protein